ncbi:hypothetical protein D9M71_678550 [compost metagenome]
MAAGGDAAGAHPVLITVERFALLTRFIADQAVDDLAESEQGERFLQQLKERHAVVPGPVEKPVAVRFGEAACEDKLTEAVGGTHRVEGTKDVDVRIGAVVEEQVVVSVSSKCVLHVFEVGTQVHLEYSQTIEQDAVIQQATEVRTQHHNIARYRCHVSTFSK